MNVDTGEIKALAELRSEELKCYTKLHADELTRLKEVEPNARPEQLLIQRKGKYRNRPCLCGSGKKFKKCCIGESADTLKSLLLKTLDLDKEKPDV